MQPEALLEFMQTGNAFVLPSTFEPWGVVAHEFAAAGYPLVLSDAVGASEAFLQQGKNGYRFQANNAEALKEALTKMMSLNAHQLQEMGASSRLLAQSITPKTWAESVVSMMR
jgi:glycosyltransferase involved in cell wall biosynthesis